MGATIKQVAKKAGVSTSTVSHVLNGTHFVSPELTARVQSAVEELNYEFNPIARSLAKGKTQVIGLLVPDLMTTYAGEVIRGIDDELANHDYDLMLYTTRRHEKKISTYVAALTRGLADGLLILVPEQADKYLKLIAKQNYPYVMIDFQGDGGVTSSVGVTNWQGGYDATRYLIELGHRRIGFVTGEMFLGCSVDRFEAYKAALAAYDMPFDSSLVYEGDFRQPSGHEAVNQFFQLSEPPTAIFASNDQMAFGVADAVRNRGLRIPYDMSIVGFDDVPEAELVRPALTTIHQPMQEMGRVAVEMLMDRIKSPERPPRRVELATELILRDTCQRIR